LESHVVRFSITLTACSLQASPRPSEGVGLWDYLTSGAGRKGACGKDKSCNYMHVENAMPSLYSLNTEN